MKAILVSLGCLSEDSIKSKELGFVLMALNIRKVVAQRAENNQKFIKRQFLYYFNRNCLFSIKNCPGLLTNYLLEDINCDLMRSALFE